ncbi:hypothetical protein HK102_007137 [Quaeritorhiza haematococci]|nr:hypothetical protein HK102_007137 [Quaeritorhiza haematococci]
MDVPVAQLAEEAKRREAKPSLVTFPMTALVVLAIAIAVIAVTLPTGLILRGSSLSTTTTLSQEILTGSVSLAVEKVKMFIARNGAVVESLAQNPYLQQFITTNFFNIHSNPMVNQMLFDARVSQFDNTGIASLLCITRNNLSGLDLPTSPYRNTTLLGVQNLLDGNVVLMYIEHQSGPALMGRVFTKNVATGGWQPVGNEGVLVPAVALPKNSTTRDIFNENVESKYDGLKCYRYSLTSTGASLIACYQNFWFNKTKDNLPDGVCSFDMNADDKFRDLLDTIQGQLSRAIVLFDEQGDIAATSLGGRDTNNCFGQFEKCNNFNSTDKTNRTFDSISESVRADLKLLYGSFDKIPYTPQIWDRNINGIDYIVGVASFNFTNANKYTLAAVIPRNQAFSSIDKANRDSIIIYVVVTVGVVTVFGSMMWFILKPLHTLSVAMERLAQLDFAALENGKLLDISSVITEISAIQNNFSVMVKAL